MHGSARPLAVLLSAGICVLAFAGTATAATTTPFGCRASAARITLLGTLTIEPTVANTGTTPCADDSAGAATVSVPTTASGIVDAGPVGAFTYSVFSPSGATSPGATAVAAVQGVTIPTAGGNIVVAGPIQTTATYSCVNDQLQATGTSTLNLINVNGVNMPVPEGTPSSTTILGITISTNQEVKTANSLTETALEVSIPGIADIVVDEAKVTQSVTDPCAGTSGPPPVLEVCPPGSTLNISAQLCEIDVTNPNGTTTVIVVSRPFQGPSGGTVYPTSEVAKKYRGYPCTTGKGPKFALVATKRGGRVYGTPKSDRILALGAYERVAGLGGNDCIDGNAAHQTIYDGNGKDRVYGGPGPNRIGVGNGNDYLNARKGSGDYITAGNGNDTVHGGTGNTRIAVGLGKDHVFGGPARNKIFAASNAAKVSCGTGRHNVADIRTAARKYAKAHGCETIHLLN
jgi:Ca2+-binding RTX toxin-like protein